MCDMKSFIESFLKTYDFSIYIPDDIIKLCLLFCGIISQLLPFASTSVYKNINTSEFHSHSYKEFYCTYDVCEAYQWFKRWNCSEIFIGIVIDEINVKEICYINYHRFIPIFSLKGSSYGAGNAKWIGWVSKYKAKNIVSTKDIYIDKTYTKKYMINDIDSKQILKYFKKRDRKRYLSRKWSAYEKLKNG
eukprot:400803_1